MKVICITPVDHLPGFLEEFNQVCNLDYEPDISLSDLRDVLLSTNYDAIFTNPNKQNFIIDKALLKGTSVRLLNTASTGLNHIDLDDCESLNVEIFSLTKDYDLIRNLPSTSELAFGLALSLMRKIPQSFDSVKMGKWDYEPFVGRQLAGLTAGIVGYGRLGTFMARYCKAFGMNVVVCDPYKNVFDHDQVSLTTLLRISDLISLHVHVDSRTKEIINSLSISLMEKCPYLINTSRGEIVNESDVLSALRDKSLSGYGTDVIVDEFSNFKNSEIVRATREEDLNLIITPHIGGMSLEGQHRAYLHAIQKF